jgi:hypothetical protein
LRIARGPRRSSNLATACAKAIRHRGRSTAGAGAWSRDDSTLGQRARRGNYEVGVRGSLARATAIDASQRESSTRDDPRQQAATRRPRQAPGNNKHRCMCHAPYQSIRTPGPAPRWHRRAHGSGGWRDAHPRDAGSRRWRQPLLRHGNEGLSASPQRPGPATAAPEPAALPQACVYAPT